MADFNQVTLVGRLTRDPETKHIASGTAVTNVSLAVGRKWFDKATNEKKDETTYVDVTLFGKTAKLVGQYCTKGSSVLIAGRLKQDSWEDKTTGQKRSKLVVVAESAQFLDSKRAAGGAGEEDVLF